MSWCHAGNAQWLDKSQQHCLVLWRKLGEWADVLYSFVRQFGLQDSVMTLDELSSGDDVKDTGVAQMSHLAHLLSVCLTACIASRRPPPDLF